MSYKINCPECNKLIYSNAKKCGCGWSGSNSQSSDQSNLKKDWRCIFELNGERCQLPGSLSHSVRQSDDWMCTYHFRYREDYKEAVRCVEFIKKHYDEIIHNRLHYGRLTQSYDASAHQRDPCNNCDERKKSLEMLEREFLNAR